MMPVTMTVVIRAALDSLTRNIVRVGELKFVVHQLGYEVDMWVDCDESTAARALTLQTALDHGRSRLRAAEAEVDAAIAALTDLVADA